MQYNNQAVQLEPSFRIQRAGCDITVNNVRVEDGSIKHRVCLVRNGSQVACAVVARNSKFAVAELEAKARQGLIGPTTGMYSALMQLADTAEQLAGEGAL